MSPTVGWVGKALRVDLRTGKLVDQTLDSGFMRTYIGGIGFTTRILWEETEVGIDALDPGSRLILATGPLNGTPASMGRWTIAAKSPLTGLIAEGQIGGSFGSQLKRAGYDMIVFQGKSEKPVWLWIDDGSAELRDARGLWGLDTFDCEDAVMQEVGDRGVSVCEIGPAGEKLVRFANVMHRKGRSGGKFGAGAVFGSKNLKAVAVRGSREVGVANPEGFSKHHHECMQMVNGSKEPSVEPRLRYGTIASVEMFEANGNPPVRYYSLGHWEGLPQVGCDVFANQYYEGKRGCDDCFMPCGHYFRVKDGPFQGLEGEGVHTGTMVPLGTELDITYPPAILKLHLMFNRLGMCAMAGGNVMGFAYMCYQQGIVSKAELSGLELNWGDYDAAIRLAEMIASRRCMGDVLAEGVKKASEIIGRGSERVAMHVKGKELSGMDPRGYLQIALGFAVTDHHALHVRLQGYTPSTAGKSPDVVEEMKRSFDTELALKRFDPRDKGRLVKWLMDRSVVFDLLQMCVFVTPYLDVGLAAGLLSDVVGVDYSKQDLLLAAERVINLERAFNVREGMSREDDALPYRVMNEGLGGGNAAGMKVPIEVLEEMKSQYYDARGWNRETACPTRETLMRLGLEDVSRELAQTGAATGGGSVKVQYLLHIRELVGKWGEDVEVQGQVSARDLLDKLAVEHGSAFTAKVYDPEARKLRAGIGLVQKKPGSPSFSASVDSLLSRGDTLYIW